ncbi:MAG: protein kinase, partial [Verrucomicrobia bacterium]|nr:protein kinase [Verrucomicrobiota bacterium]
MLEEIGRGGMGVVYKGRQLSLNRTVAVKVILSGRFATVESIQRFRAEAEAAAGLQHSNIVAIHDVGEHRGQHYFSMDYIEGQCLAELVRENPLPPRRAASYVQRIATAIQYAHEHGTIHRDLKPSNVLIDQLDEPRIADFGLAKRVAVDRDLTTTGQVIGSPSFLAPEQARGQGAKAGPACDIYALGALLYFLLTGRPPFLSESLEGTLHLVLNTDAISPRLLNPAVPRDLETICLKCLEKEAQRRYPSAERVADELGRFLQDQPIQARPLSRLEKIWRLCRRHPATASLSAAVVILFLAGFAGVSWQWGVARKNALAEAHQRERVEEALSQMELQRAEDLFRAGDSSSGLAYLARVLRKHPGNRIAAERLLSALSHRSFALPALQPIQHEAPVTDADFSPDGRLLVTSGQDGTLKLWEARTGEVIFSRQVHTSAIHSVRFSPDGRKVATGSQDKTVRIWDAETGQALTDPLRHKSAVSLLDWSPDGSRIVTACGDQTARVWEAQTGAAITEPLGHNSSVTSVQFSKSGKWIVTSTWLGIAQLWSAETGHAVGPPLKHPLNLYSARFSPDETRLVTAGYDGKARLWAVPSGQLLGKPLAHDDDVRFAAFSPDGIRVVSVSGDRTARLWNADNGELLATLKHGAWVNHAEFSEDGQRLLTVTADNSAWVWDVMSAQPLVEPIKHGGRLARARFSPDGERIVTAYSDKTAWVWDVRPGQMLGWTLWHTGQVSRPRFSPNGAQVVTTSWDNTAKLCDLKSGETFVLAHPGWVLTAEFNRDGDRILTAAADVTARLWDSRTGQEVGPALRHGARLAAAQFSHDGRRIATAGWDGIARVWDAHSGKLLAELSRHATRLRQAEFSRDGRYIVTASVDGVARLWDAENGRALGPDLQHESQVNQCQFSPNSRRVLTASSDHTARIWAVPTGRPIGDTLRHLGPVRFGEFSPDGQRVVTASDDHTARVWDAWTGKPLIPLMRHEGPVMCAQFSPEGSRIITASGDATARVWDAATGKPLSELLRHKLVVFEAEFSPDARRVMTASLDGSARVWELPVVSASCPPWLPLLAEAVAGQQVIDDGSFVSSDRAYLARLKSELENGATADAHRRWAKWFLSDRSGRTISPDLPVRVSEYVARQIAENSLGSLLEALRLSPTNGLAMARLARLMAVRPSDPDAGRTNQADLYSRRAVAWAPEEAESWWARAEVLELTGDIAGAVDAMQRASDRNPPDPLFWNAKGKLLERKGQLEEAYQAYSRAIELQRTRNDLPGRTKSLRNRRDVLLRMNRRVEAQADWLLAKNISPRDPQATPELIDLSLHYNAALDEDWHGMMWKGNNLATLPKGRQTLGGVEFDIRGIIQLAGIHINKSAPGYPKEVQGLA